MNKIIGIAKIGMRTTVEHKIGRKIEYVLRSLLVKKTTNTAIAITVNINRTIETIALSFRCVDHQENCLMKILFIMWMINKERRVRHTKVLAALVLTLI